ncbi:hypothetical protein E8E12_010599 [Didymella heteroderae]|uniref:PLL-like beta propeller domain-containing protein n=1 Tax=Didymella heteroderae TaxID=1769908 RepID=A0A9P4WXM1_9PLEO|nr:hypothetical protein E8E12_010599 [Didymella heteroderae]
MSWYLGDIDRYITGRQPSGDSCDPGIVAMEKQTAPYADEVLPNYSVQDEQPKPPKRRWWWRKRVWMPSGLLIVLLLFGIIFGAAYGSKRSNSEDAQSDRDRFFAAQGSWNTSSSSRQPTSTTYSSSSAHWNNDYFPTYSSSSSYPYPTPAPPQSDGILQPQGLVPRDISATVGAPGLILWNLESDKQLYRKEQGGDWEVYSDRKFIFAPITVSTGDTTQIAVSVDAISGRIMYMHFQDGQWDAWQELEFAAVFLRRPAIISRAQDKVDIINVDRDGHIWIVSYDGTQWSSWTELGNSVYSEVTATTWGEDRIDVFASRGENVIHKLWSSESGWMEDWDDLGDPWKSSYHDPRDNSGSPLAVSWRDGDDGVIDVYMAREGKGSSHKTFRNGEWSDWKGMLASHEGYEFAETQSIARGDGQDGRPFAYLLSRGTDDGIHFNAHDGTDWGSWVYLWLAKDRALDYPTRNLATFIAGGGSANVELIAKDVPGNVMRLELSSIPKQSDWVYDTGNDKWESWGMAPGNFPGGK